jgi:XTP/dITP diphosphohydrolase
MTTAARPVRLCLATRNQHKVGEIRAILGSHLRYLTLNDFPGAPVTVEDAGTFAGNATKKAIELARWISQNGTLKSEAPDSVSLVLADDSGLEVDALNGAPGVHSARFAAIDAERSGNSCDADNNARLLRLLKDIPPAQRTARFRCILALTPVLPASPENASPVCFADEFEAETEIFEGACEGRIGFAPRGPGGFGYDPLFTPEGYQQTFGELGPEIKNSLSHRAKALAALKRGLESRSVTGK